MLAELQVQFAVVATALLGDHPQLKGVEAGHVNLVKHCERDGEDDIVGHHFAGAAASGERTDCSDRWRFFDLGQTLASLGRAGAVLDYVGDVK